MHAKPTCMCTFEGITSYVRVVGTSMRHTSGTFRPVLTDEVMGRFLTRLNLEVTDLLKTAQEKNNQAKSFRTEAEKADEHADELRNAAEKKKQLMREVEEELAAWEAAQKDASENLPPETPKRAPVHNERDFPAVNTTSPQTATRDTTPIEHTRRAEHDEREPNKTSTVRSAVRAVISSNPSQVWTGAEVLVHLPSFGRRTVDNCLGDLTILGELERIKKGRFRTTRQFGVHETNSEHALEAKQSSEQANGVRKAVLDVLRQDPTRWWRAREVAENLTDVRISYARTVLGRMVGYGEVIKDAEGAYQLRPHMARGGRAKS
jgi:hypothetical protein